MMEHKLLSEILENIRLARTERRRALQKNVESVKRLRGHVQKERIALKKQIETDAKLTKRSLRRFVDRNRTLTSRMLSSAKATRERFSMRLRFENSSATNQRKRTVQSLLRSSASKRHLGEIQRRRATAMQLASIKAFVGKL